MTENQLDRNAIENIVASVKSRLDMWIRLITAAQTRDMAEVGVWKGEFAEATLRACPAIRRYFMIDPWRRLDQWNKPLNIDDGEFEDVYNEALQRTEFSRERRFVLRGTTLEVIDKIPDEGLDFIYIDGDHTLRGVTIDLITCYAEVKPGCYLGGDDFCQTIWQHSPEFEPTLVFPFALNFAEAVGATIYCLPLNQFLLQKANKRERRFAVVDFTGQYGQPELLPQLSQQSLISKSLQATMPSPFKTILRKLRQGLKTGRS